jgi:flagellar basal body-associated protein FliL
MVENSYAPVVELTSPSGLKPLSGDVKITWSASDKNGDTLTVKIMVGQKCVITGHPNEGTHTWDSTEVANGDYEMRITVSDGKNTASDFVKIKIANRAIEPEPEPEEPEVTKPKEEGGMSAGVIVAVVVLSLIMVLAVCGLVVFFVVFKKKNKKGSEIPPPTQQAPPGPPMATPPPAPQAPPVEVAQTATPIATPQTQPREGDWNYKSYNNNGTNTPAQNNVADSQQYMETKQNYNNYL